MNRNKRYNSGLSLNDLLFNVLLGFVLLFIIAFLLIQPPTKTGDVPSKAEVLITLEWDPKSSADIDLWVQQDDFAPIGYSNKGEQAVHLDRDDLGSSNDTIIVNGAHEVIKINREIVTLRGVVAGEYFIGVHAYNLSKGPLEVTVMVMDVNPLFKEYYKRTVTLDRRGDKINLPGFTLDSKGRITDVWEHSRDLGPRKKVTEYQDSILRNNPNNNLGVTIP